MKIRKGVFRLMAVLAVGTLFLVIVPPTAAQAAGCWENACTGRNPSTMGCGNDAWTTTSVTPVGGGPAVELRHSAVCNAVWARSDPYWSFSVQGANAKGGPPVLSYTNGGGSYTLMIGFNYWVRACIKPAGYSNDQSSWTCTGWY
jgi:hypothetical protein